jgi:SAM-dependent methyltransferase
MPHDVTRESVIWAYRLILGREPESDSVVNGATSYSSIAELRKSLLESHEFRSIHPPRLLPLDAPPMRVECAVDDQVLSRLLSTVQKTWKRLGRERPHWSVLSAEQFLPENIQASESAFYESGRFDVQVLNSALVRANRSPRDFRTVFEFGCGLGRVTPYLATTFEHVIACDVSSTHLEQARLVIERSNANNVALTLVVQAFEFGMRDHFDLWFSRLVLQHNPPPLIAMILRRAFFLLNSGGLAVFQVPTYAINYEFRIEAYLEKIDNDHDIEMHVIPQDVIFQLARENGCVLLEVVEDGASGPSNKWRSNTFVLQKL